MRWATPKDRAWIERMLALHADWTLFPAANLATFGLNGTAPRSMRFLIGGDGMLPVSVEGMAFPLPGMALPGVAAALAGNSLIGAVGQEAAVNALISDLRAGEVPTFNAPAEPFMVLSLSDLVLPEGAGRLSPVTPDLVATVTGWRRDFRQTLLGEDAVRAADIAARDVQSWSADNRLRVLVDEAGAPLALTGFSARAGDRALIGGVYTPPEGRGRGLARRAVALHLAEAGQDGLGRALLSAGSEPARRAYQAIGFRQIDTARMLIFRDPFRVAT